MHSSFMFFNHSFFCTVHLFYGCRWVFIAQKYIYIMHLRLMYPITYATFVTNIRAHSFAFSSNILTFSSLLRMIDTTKKYSNCTLTLCKVVFLFRLISLAYNIYLFIVIRNLSSNFSFKKVWIWSLVPWKLKWLTC
jgi:hypothetical protein